VISDIKYRIADNKIKVRSIISIIDKIGYAAFDNKYNTMDWRSISSIAILQLGQIGDFILTLPFIKYLKKKTGKRITCIINGLNYELARRFQYIDDIIVATPPYMDRTMKSNYWDFVKNLAKIQSDIVFDLRGDIRNLMAVYFACRRSALVGFADGGGGFLLSNKLEYPHDEHISASFNAILKEMNIFEDPLMIWEPKDIPSEVYQQEKFSADFIAIHVSTGAPARQWPMSNFIEMIQRLAQDFPLVILGTQNDLSTSQCDKIAHLPNVELAIGKTSLLQAIDIVSKSRLFVGLESSFAHVASLAGRPLLALYSGATTPKVWGPHVLYPGQVSIIRKYVGCSGERGCGKLVCSNNMCMKLISVDDVENKIRNLVTQY
jgi:heptosyltransferase II